MEYCSKGDLFDFLKHKVRGYLPANVANSIFNQILDGVQCIHEQAGMAHLDLKLENILLSNDYQIKLCDLGFSQSAYGRLFQLAGTDGYKAPEIHKIAEGSLYDEEDDNHSSTESTGENNTLRNAGYAGVQADIFSLGVILFTLHYGVPPFTEASLTDRFYKLLNFKGGAGKDRKSALKFFLKSHPSTKELFANNMIDYELMDLITSLLAENPNERPSNIGEVRNHPYLKE